MIFESRGIDGNKKINGRKRQVLVDVLGRLWKVKVHAAHQHDSPEGVGLLEDMPEQFPRLEKIMADKSYRGTFAQAGLCCMNPRAKRVFPFPFKAQATFTAIGAAI
jgi:hypothetical protein